MRRNSRILTALAAVASVAALVAIAPSAQASYFDTEFNGVCKNSTALHGIGMSGGRGAMVAWGNTLGAPSPAAPLQQGFGYDAGADYATCAAYRTAADGGTKVFDYRATGSGSCLDILGAKAANDPRTWIDTTPEPDVTVNDVGYCGTEDAPTEAQIGFAEEGPPAHPSEAQMVTIPVAQVAITISVRLPDQCFVDQAGRSISRTEANLAFQGVNTKWSDIFGTDIKAQTGSGLTNQQCQDKVFQRVVRKDNSGTTFLLKRYLHAASNLAGGDGFDWREPSIGGTLANNAWPNDVANPVVRGDENGTGSMLDKLNSAPLGANGGLSYGDVSTARTKTYGWVYNGSTYDANDTKIWLRVQRISNELYNSPAITNAQVASGNNAASACLNVDYVDEPTTNLGQSWSDATAVATPTDYSVCGLNYVVTSRWGFDTEAGRFRKVFEGSNQGEFRVVRDFLRYVTGIIKPGDGPAKLPPAGFSKMPADIQATAQCASKLIGWLRSGSDGQPGDAIPRDPSGTDPDC